MEILEQNRVEMNNLRSQVSLFESKCSNGVFYWRIKNFSTVSQVVHSPGFYTSFRGYKLCVRINVDRSETTGSLSMFVHFMKDDNDDILTWPFSGRIIFSIIDQNHDSTQRKNITEPLVSDPKLEAFKKPTSTRNPKGFGFQDFVNISLLNTRMYLKNDVLIVKITVIPQTKDI